MTRDSVSPFKKAVLEVWRKLNVVPDCRECHGSGEPLGFSETVYWKGKEVVVCANCGGSGKV